MKKVLVIFVLLAVIVVSIILYNREKLKTATHEDINIEAILKQNTNENLDYKDYMLEVVIHQEKDSKHIIYPYIEGLDTMTFDSNEEDGYYIPGSIGAGGSDIQPVNQALKGLGIMKEDVNYFPSYMIGFYSPEEAGTYKMRMYFESEMNFEVSEDMYLIYVHKRTITSGLNFGIDKIWTKVIKIKSDL